MPGPKAAACMQVVCFGRELSKQEGEERRKKPHVTVIKLPTATGDSCSTSLVPFGNPDEIHLRTVALGGEMCPLAPSEVWWPRRHAGPALLGYTYVSPLLSENTRAQGKVLWLPCGKLAKACSQLVPRAAAGARCGTVGSYHEGQRCR